VTSSPPPPAHRKFGFDTEFSDSGDAALIAYRPKRQFTAEDVEQARQEGFAQGQASALARAEQAAAAALIAIANEAKGALGALTHVAHEHRAACAELALATGRTIAGAALEQFPDAPASAALAVLAREVEAAPRLMVRCAADLVERTQAALDRAAEACGYPGQVLVRADAALPHAAFVFDWGDGRASFDPVDAAERVADALRTALAAEGLHAEPLTLQPPAGAS
jgi:flagellar assembly protein FliH